MEILPIIADKNFNNLCVIDNYTSLIWTSRYFSVGDFEICVPVTENTLNYVKQDYYIIRPDDDHVGIIEDIKIQKNEDNKELMIITGRFLSSILGRRIVAVQTQINNMTISNGIYKLINEAIINPSIAKRKISNFTLGNYASSESFTQQITGKNLLETIQDICQTYNLGFKTILTNDNEFKFILYEGLDRTYDQSVNDYVIFSDKYDNLKSSDYEENYLSIVTNVLIAGEGEGTDRKTLWVTKEDPQGLDRYEYYQDARNASTNDGEISDQEYYAQLQGEAMENITDYTTSFTGQVDFTGVVYKQDVNLGDLCVIENTKWGLYIYARLVEVIESVDESGAYTVLPTFSL